MRERPFAKPCPFCGQGGKVWHGEAMGVLGGGAGISHNSPGCPAKGLHDLQTWNNRPTLDGVLRKLNSVSACDDNGQTGAALEFMREALEIAKGKDCGY